MNMVMQLLLIQAVAPPLDLRGLHIPCHLLLLHQEAQNLQKVIPVGQFQSRKDEML